MSEILLKSPSDCIKIDKYNFKSMLEGYEKNGKIIRTSIYCQTIRFPDNFLITPSRAMMIQKASKSVRSKFI